jgi:hypothetical protein
MAGLTPVEQVLQPATGVVTLQVEQPLAITGRMVAVGTATQLWQPEETTGL